MPMKVPIIDTPINQAKLSKTIARKMAKVMQPQLNKHPVVISEFEHPDEYLGEEFFSSSSIASSMAMNAKKSWK